MIYEITGAPKRPGMVCWQIRHERQADGSTKVRHVYGAKPSQLDQVPAIVDQVMLQPSTIRGIRAATQGSLI